MNFKIFSFLIFLLILQGCSVIPDRIKESGSVGSNFTQTFNALKALVYGYEDFPITQDLVNKIPYASLRMKIGKGPAGLLILESVNGNEYTWVSADNIYINTKEGRIIRAEGLINNLTDFYSSEPSFKEVINSPDSFFEQYRYVSFDNPEAFNIKIKTSYKVLGLEEVIILDTKRELTLIEESIENEYLRWIFINQYWVDTETGFVWQSNQVIAPNLPSIFIQITKKPSI